MKYFILFFFFTSAGLQLYAQDCIADWNYYRTVTIDNSAGEALTDYQVQIRINSAELAAAGKLQLDGDDLRVFANDCSPLPFWADSIGTSMNTSIWVKVPNISAGGSVDLQVYYGNESAASAADGDNTFLFFDDFSSNTIDPAKWEAVGEFAILEVEDGVLNYQSTAMNPGPRFKFVRTVASFEEEVVYDFVSTRSSSSGFGFSSSNSLLRRIIFRAASFGPDTLNQVAYMQDTLNNGVQIEGAYPLIRHEDREFRTISIQAANVGGTNMQFTRFANETINSVSQDTFNWIQLQAPAAHFILSSFSSAGNGISLDNFRVRQAVDNPPLATLNAEVNLDPNGVRYLLDASHLEVFPNPSQGQLQLRLAANELAMILISDGLGRIVFQTSRQFTVGEVETISLDQLEHGQYYLRLNRILDGSALQFKRIILN